MQLLHFINNQRKNKYLFLLFLFVITLIFRLPTLFNDYYDVDELAAIVQTYEYLAGDIQGKDFHESKLPVYHSIFKLSYSLSYEMGYVLVHLITILIIFLTSVFIYLIGSKLYNINTGVLGALLYSILISSFNRHFMATNGEIIFNLPITAGLYFYIKYLSGKKAARLLNLSLVILMGIISAQVKFQGIIFFIFFVFITIIYYPYFINKFTSKYFLFLTLVGLFFTGLFFIDYFYTNHFAELLIMHIRAKLFYSFAGGFNPLTFIAKYSHRQGMLTLWHLALWIPASIYIFRFIKNRFKANTLEESAVVILFLLNYLMVFTGAERLYFHYFIAAYPSLCIISSIGIINLHSKKIISIKKNLGLLILIPSLFFFLWNMKDIAIKHFYPGGFYNEGKILFWSRAVLVGSFNDYLLPESSYNDVCHYIKKTTKPDDKIFVWGDGPYIYYFSKRRMGGTSLWPKNTIAIINWLYKQGDSSTARVAKIFENDIISALKTKKPVLFIDTSENGLSSFHYKLASTPLIYKYVIKKYSFLHEINMMKIYKLK